MSLQQSPLCDGRNRYYANKHRQELKHHARVVRRTAFKKIPAVKFFKVYLFNDTVNNPDRIVLGNKIA